MLAAQPYRLLFDHRVELKLRRVGELFDKPHLQFVFVGFRFHRQAHAPQLVATGLARPEDLQNPAFVRQRLRKLPLRGAVHQVDRRIDI